MKLNPNQIEFMLDHYFEDDYEIHKCFDTCNRKWIKAQDIELKPDNYGWHDVMVNGTQYTSINTEAYEADFEQMMKIK